MFYSTFNSWCPAVESAFVLALKSHDNKLVNKILLSLKELMAAGKRASAFNSSVGCLFVCLFWHFLLILSHQKIVVSAYSCQELINIGFQSEIAITVNF